MLALFSSRARSIFAVFKMRERLDVKSAKSNTIATTTIRRSVRRGVIPIRVIFTLFLTLFVVFVILPVTLGRGFSVADSARRVLRGFALLRRRVGLLRRLRGRVFLQTFERLPERFAELAELELVDRLEDVVHADGLPFAVAADVVRGRGQVMNEDLGALAEGLEGFLLDVPVRALAALAVACEALVHQLRQLLLHDPLDVRARQIIPVGRHHERAP
mmetsp:Transcript_1832/g.6015  ORF Transcript_1832/g.6015 Transcript_1832/m.6015 type:complete len:217 (-) Transcript_1832:10-660(-)